MVEWWVGSRAELRAASTVAKLGNWTVVHLAALMALRMAELMVAQTVGTRATHLAASTVGTMAERLAAQLVGPMAAELVERSVEMTAGRRAAS